jgi:hypothetical protein
MPFNKSHHVVFQRNQIVGVHIRASIVADVLKCGDFSTRETSSETGNHSFGCPIQALCWLEWATTACPRPFVIRSEAEGSAVLFPAYEAFGPSHTIAYELGEPYERAYRTGFRAVATPGATRLSVSYML